MLKATILPLALVLAGCAGIDSVRPEDTIDPNSYYVAFSIKTTPMSAFDTDWRPNQLAVAAGSQAGKVLPVHRHDDVALFLLETAKPTLTFGRFVIGSDIRFATETDGPSIELAPGEITYLGRIEVRDILFRVNDERTAARPAEIALVFADRGNADLAEIGRRYPGFGDQSVINATSRTWAENDYVPLAYMYKTYRLSKVDGDSYRRSEPAPIRPGQTAAPASARQPRSD